MKKRHTTRHVGSKARHHNPIEAPRHNPTHPLLTLTPSTTSVRACVCVGAGIRVTAGSPAISEGEEAVTDGAACVRAQHRSTWLWEEEDSPRSAGRGVHTHTRCSPTHEARKEGRREAMAVAAASRAGPFLQPSATSELVYIHRRVNIASRRALQRHHRGHAHRKGPSRPPLHQR